MRAFLREILVTLILAGIIFFLLQATIQSSVVVGCSMEPGLEEGQRLLVNKAFALLITSELTTSNVSLLYPVIP